MPARYNMTIWTGQSIDQKTWVATLKDANGNLIDLTGCTAFMEVRDTQRNLILHLGTDNGYLVLGAAAGTITPAVPSAATVSLPGGTYNYDLFVQYPGSPAPVEPELFGLFTINQSNTQTV